MVCIASSQTGSKDTKKHCLETPVLPQKMLKESPATHVEKGTHSPLMSSNGSLSTCNSYWRL